MAVNGIFAVVWRNDTLGRLDSNVFAYDRSPPRYMGWADENRDFHG